MMGAVGWDRCGRSMMLVMLMDLRRSRMVPVVIARIRGSAQADEEALQDKSQNRRERNDAADLSLTCGCAPHDRVIYKPPSRKPWTKVRRHMVMGVVQSFLSL